MSTERDDPSPDATHWLWRLDALGWLDAAAAELELANLHASERRRCVTHVRRGLGMALNAVLVAMSSRGWARSHAETIWQRSYLDHLRAVAQSDLATSPLTAPDGGPAAPLFARILAVPVAPAGGLVQLGRRASHDVERLLDDARDAFMACERLVRADRAT